MLLAHAHAHIYILFYAGQGMGGACQYTEREVNFNTFFSHRVVGKRCRGRRWDARRTGQGCILVGGGVLFSSVHSAVKCI